MKKNTFNNVLEVEKKVGIEVFLTKNKGIGGKLRFYPEDFIVDETDTKFSVKELWLLNVSMDFQIRVESFFESMKNWLDSS